MKQLSNIFESLKVIQFVMGIVGGLPPTILSHSYTKWDTIYLIYSLFILISFGVLFVLSQLLNVLFNTDNIILIADSSYIMIEQLAFCIKALIVMKNWKKIRTIFEKLQSPEMNSHSPDQDHIIKESMWIAKRNATAYYITIVSFNVMTFQVPLAMGFTDLFFPGWYPYDPYAQSTFVYVLTYAWQEIGLILCANWNGSIDILFTDLLVLVCGQLNVLSNSLENIRQTAISRLNEKEIYYTNNTIKSVTRNNYIITLEKYDAILDEAIYEEIIRCVRHHYEILKLVEMIKDVFLNIVFIQFASSVLVLCVTTFEITLLDDPTILGIVFFQIVMLQQLFLYCWYGNEVYYTSLNLFNGAYMSEWNGSGKKVRQAIAIILDRTKYPILLKAGHLLDLTLDTFIAIIKLSYSFYTLLEGAQDEKSGF